MNERLNGRTSHTLELRGARRILRHSIADYAISYHAEKPVLDSVDSSVQPMFIIPLLKLAERKNSNTITI